jgi:hypothetical protein
MATRMRQGSTSFPTVIELVVIPRYVISDHVAFLASISTCCRIATIVWYLWGNLIHISYQIVLRSEIHGECVRNFVEIATIKIMSNPLDNQVKRMRRTSYTKHLIVTLLLQKSGDTTVSARHGVLTIGADKYELVAPTRTYSVQKGFNQLDVADGRVPLKNGTITKCRLQSTPSTQTRMRSSNKDTPK